MKTEYHCKRPLTAIRGDKHIRVCVSLSTPAGTPDKPLLAKIGNKDFNVSVTLRTSSRSGVAQSKQQPRSEEPSAQELQAFVLSGFQHQRHTKQNKTVPKDSKLAHKMCGLHRRRGRAKLNRHLNGKGNAKDSTFDFGFARHSMANPNANPQQISSAIQPKVRSPSKKVLKSKSKIKIKRNEQSQQRCISLEKSCAKLKQEKRFYFNNLGPRRRRAIQS